MKKLLRGSNHTEHPEFQTGCLHHHHRPHSCKTHTNVVVHWTRLAEVQRRNMSQEHVLFFSCIGGCRGEKAADIQTLTHRDQPSAMTTSSPVLTFTWLLKGTLRAAEGELTLLLISSYTCFSQSVCGFKATIKAGFVTFGWLFLPHLKTYSFTVSLD